MSNILTQYEHTIHLDKLDESTDKNVNVALVQKRISDHDAAQRKRNELIDDTLRSSQALLRCLERKAFEPISQSDLQGITYNLEQITKLREGA